MNFLAHALLSFEDQEILTGNMISDFVKGKKKYDYSPRIQQGIALHREIDAFTDIHPSVKKAKEFFKPAYGLYAGAFIDVAFDHFLALDEKEFPAHSLMHFSQSVYIQLERFVMIFPPDFLLLFPHMKKHNWLLNYSKLVGIERSFESIALRAKFINESKTASQLFQQHYLPLKECYAAFFPELKGHAYAHFHNIL